MQAEAASALPSRVVVAGEDPDGRSGGLTSLRPRPGGAGLAVVGTLALAHASYVVAHPGRPWLFVAQEFEQGRVSSVRLEDDGSFTLLSSVATGGSGSCHVALTPDGRHVLVADYGSGTVCAVTVGPDGRLGGRSGFWRLEGSGPDPERQASPHAHQVVIDGSEVLVADLGSDRVHRLRLGDDGALGEAGPPVLLPPGSGPRHLVVVQDHLVVASELSGELWLGRRDPGGGWTEQDRVPCTGRPDGEGTNPSALRADGDTLLVANRGPGTVATFALDRAAGTLLLRDERSAGGRWPRDLALTNTLLWLAHPAEDLLTAVSRSSGARPEPVWSVPAPGAACVLLLGRPGDNLVP